MLGSATGGPQGGGFDVASALPLLLSQSGGLQGLLQKFQAGGLGDAVASWVGTGQNLPVSAEQLQSVLGSRQLNEVASKLGIDSQQLSSQLAQHLPGLIDQVTPNGQVPEAGNLLAQGTGLLKGFMKS